jgi:tetratricopeptide (TPR) repeat protein
MAEHRWIRAPRQRDRVAARSELALPPVLAVVNAHRRLRGPYTAVGTLLRAIVPDALDRCPDLVQRHDTEIIDTAPELRGTVSATRETLTSRTPVPERTRFYARLRTLRMSHGLVDFVANYLRVLGGEHTLIVDDAHEADPTDQEFLAVLLRRIDPELLTVVVTTGTGPLVPPPGPETEPLRNALEAHCTRLDGPDRPVDSATEISDVSDLARDYVFGGCIDDDPAAIAAYERLDAEERKGLHDACAAELRAREEFSLLLGAIPYHLERGSDPVGAAVPALRHALEHCQNVGFYHAMAELSARGLALVNRETDEVHWKHFVAKLAAAFSASGRIDEAHLAYEEARRGSTSPLVHIQAAYGLAMLYTRHYDPEQRDHQAALGWINLAIALAGTMTERKVREFNTVWYRNGLALIELHLGNLEEALSLLDHGIARLQEEFPPGEWLHFRTILRYNRCQVLASLGRLEESVDSYAELIDIDPNWAEYHFDQAGILRRLGRLEESLAEYTEAIRLSSPFPEVFYNRGDLRAEMGDVEGAIADFSYVLELQPDFVDACVNRAGLYLELGDLDAAERDAATGLGHDPDAPHLHAVLGQIHAERGDYPAARSAFDRALAADPDLVSALSGRATVAHELGDVEIALADLSHAVEVQPDNPLLRFNRAFVYQSSGQWERALADLDVARDLDPDDPDVADALAIVKGAMTPS